MKGYYTIRDVCERFHVSREAIRRWVRDRGFPQSVDLIGCARGRKVFIIEEVELWELVRRNARQPTRHVNPLL